MHVLANWVSEPVQFLYCSIIYHADCNSGPFCTFKWTFLYILVDLLVDLSLTEGVLQCPENPPPPPPPPGYGLGEDMGSPLPPTLPPTPIRNHFQTFTLTRSFLLMTNKRFLL